MKSMKFLRRSVAITVRYSPRERPVTRIRMFPKGSTIEYWSGMLHFGLPGAGISSTV